jgi:glycosyltransferase involved in cell wall biosynthesis
MVAARLLGISYSFTLHGSDLLLHKAYLEVKLRHCRFCFTVSEFNRRHILEHYPGVDPKKIVVQRLGVEVPDLSRREPTPGPMTLLSVGRLHPVKDHAFLVRACHRLKREEISFLCQIAGDGPERPHLARLVTDLGLENEIQFLGQVSRERLRLLYRAADLVVVTSRSEGIPLVLMEAMAQGTPVLAPAITGIPELVLPGQTGFLYEPGSLESFVASLREFRESSRPLLRRRAWQHVARHFHREKNLARFATRFLERCVPQPKPERPEHAYLVLQ